MLLQKLRVPESVFYVFWSIAGVVRLIDSSENAGNNEYQDKDRQDD